MRLSLYVGIRAALRVLLSMPLATAGCSSLATPVSDRGEHAFPPIATMHDIMVAEVDPSADSLWDAVAYIATPNAVEERRPRTDEEWEGLRHSAIILIEATSLLAIPGRRVAVASSPAAPGELSAEEIQQRVDTNRATFDQFAGALRSVALTALAAIDNRDPKALLNAGGAVDEACEACHRVYWYPGQK
jgi:hypothetical protein